MAIRVEETLERRAPSFGIPPELEAREPAEVRGRGRDDVRLLVTRGPKGVAQHAVFADLPSFLDRGDLLVINTSATVPSSVRTRVAGEPEAMAFDLSVSTRLDGGLCVVEPRKREGLQPGDVLLLPGGATATLHGHHRASRRLWVASFNTTGDLIAYLFEHGTPIAYQHMRATWPIETYQTVYATEAGSAEMPSAGRPFTHEMLARLRSRGVGIATVVLHTGVSSLERDEPPYEERYRVPEETAARVRRTRANGGRVIAVGTTVVRALESAARGGVVIAAAEGWTDLLITPGRPLRAVDAIITGLHEPRSTHLAMLEAIAGDEHVASAYRCALDGRYLWHEFGDSHLMLP